ncbi:hypothetical protein CJFNICFP_00130 [Vibrio phage VMJ710]|jgi:hypothetical protein|nr:hypothetical protein TUST1-191_01015 [Vibrio phage ICP1_2006_D]ADX88476.1 hypothetical protein TUST1-182_01015 [Vibrio phage ICP1_2006_C]ADX88700.1 hypothetical protein TUST1-159_01000 [Vibrio phage ICP1_2006_B]ADX88926.1 hypothetical protein TUST1-17_01000 [Vibrio phage ICP1_2006_A]ADX89156.1 hypothetical protein TUST1-15_01020 [Vibrio phage ICP1_2005_A]ADX89386.1 hypothetical protein TUST1-2_01030 [Vibrio phage ICP1_2001_A]ADX89613.1 hypothetical protein TUST1-10_01005 [Vibrio phage ICP1
MKLRFNKGDTVVATKLSTREQVVFSCPSDNMCQHLLKRYLILVLGKFSSEDKIIFTKQ